MKKVVFITILFLCIFFFFLHIHVSRVKEKHRQMIKQELEQINSHSKQGGQGFLAIIKGDYESALKNFSKAIESDSQNPILYHQRGIAYYNLEDYDNAIKDFNKTIALDTKNIDAYGNRSLAKMKINDFQGALDDIEIVLKIVPNHQKAIKQKEMILEKMNER